MVKGFIIYKNGKIPFVIDKYRMELFTVNAPYPVPFLSFEKLR